MSRLTVAILLLLVTGLTVDLDTAAEASPQWEPGEPVVDERDGRSYRTVVIGDQVWLAENMNLGDMVASSGPGAIMEDNGVVEKYCYDNDETNCDGTDDLPGWGGFYEWQEAVQYYGGQPELPVQGICPEGWHIPSGGEWTELLTGLGGDQAYLELGLQGSSGFDAQMTGYR